MLSLLRIQNLALVDSLHWELDSGLIGVTGETGAGKSVIVGALKLVLGERADKSLIRTGESKCSVEAVFEMADPSDINEVLQTFGIDPCEDRELFIRRVITPTGTKQFVNHSPATLAVLKTLGKCLVDLHGPHDHQSLLDLDRQLSMLDGFAGSGDEKALYEKGYVAWKRKSSELQTLVKSEQAGSQELDLLQYQHDEIERAQVDPASEDDLQERCGRAQNAGKLVSATLQAHSILTNENGVLDQLAEMQKAIRELSESDPASHQWTSGLDTAVVELQELEGELLQYAEKVDLDPEALVGMEDRVNTLESLKRKYGGTLEEVLAYQQQIGAKLETYQNRDELIDRLEKEVEKAMKELREVGTRLSKKRRASAPKLAKLIRLHLADLGFHQAAFEIQLERISDPESQGLETVEYFFGPNPGEPLKPLRQIASSGEMSRVMLAVKSALADQDATPLMVFDEIDANVGGEIARAVGEKMAHLGERHQVVAITHFPQVAASAKQHFLVAKHVEEGRTVSSLMEVDGEDRVAELVRMLGGGGPEVRAMAESLLGGVK